jgi:hypothetical protein
MRTFRAILLGGSLLACGEATSRLVDAPVTPVTPIDTTVNLAKMNVAGTYILTSCRPADAAAVPPPCPYLFIPRIDGHYYLDSTRVEFHSDGTLRWKEGDSGNSYHCSDFRDPACLVRDTFSGVIDTVGTYSIASDSLMMVTLPVSFGYHNPGAGLRFRPRITYANHATWKPDAIEVVTYGLYGESVPSANTLRRVP